MAGSDANIRVLGLYVGLFFFASLWLCSRWLGCRAPILSVALLGSLPVFIFILGANRAYGLASALLVLSFGLIWRMVEHPSRSRILGTALVCILFAQCVYYDVVFLCAMLSGAAMVAIRRRQWKTLWALVGIGAASGASLIIYLPVIHQGSLYTPMHRFAFFNFTVLWYKLRSALAARSSAHFPQFDAQEVWLWMVVLLGGLTVALLMQLTRKTPGQNQKTAPIAAIRSAPIARFSAG